MRGLYLHLPFCERKCHYCNFVISLKHQPSDRQLFYTALRAEIQHAAQSCGRLEFDTLYLGGGTPSLLPVSELADLIELLKKTFVLKDGGEWTIEINPEDVQLEKLQAYRTLGINRASLGAQAFQDRLLRECGRVHSVERIYHAMDDFHRAGFDNITLDLINRLPGQTLDEFEFSLKEAVRIGAKQISLYDLEVHRQTVFGRRQASGQLPVPSEALHEAMFERADQCLGAAGLPAYEISTFARPGFESRHNLIYWHNQEYLGLGPGAFSYLAGHRFQFASDMRRYLGKTAAQDWTRDSDEALSAEKMELETLLTGLRLLREGVALNRLPLLASRLQPELRLIEEAGLICIQQETLRLTHRGRFLAETVLARLTHACC